MDARKIFSPSEQADFDLVRAVRHKVIKEYSEGDLPKSFDMDRLLTVTTQLESGALSQAKIRIKQQEADGKDVNSAILAQLVLDIQNNPREHIIEGEFEEVDDNLLMLPDHLDIEPVDGGLRQGDRNPDLYDEIFSNQSVTT